MYVHIGNGKMLRVSDILGIFDTDNSTVSKNTRTWLTKKEKAGRLESATDEIPKSFILTMDENGEEKIYFSQLSSSTLKTRVEKINNAQF
ncbi:MAG: DUF370 domain-containing protein [Clostridiales bacterium]|nr:DUF370 domain-containing protein [Clostridiales bacterium]